MLYRFPIADHPRTGARSLALRASGPPRRRPSELRGISLKPPKWLRKIQPGKIIERAATNLPIIGSVVGAIGDQIRAVGERVQTGVATVREVSTSEGRREAQGVFARAKSALDDLDTTKKVMLAVGVGIAVLVVVMMVRRR